MAKIAHFKPIIPVAEDSTEKFVPSDEQKYWMEMQEIAQFEDSNNVISCDFRPTELHNLAVASGRKLTIYETETNEPIAIYNRFKSPLSFLKYRHDGALLGASTQDGLLQFFDIHLDKQNKNGPRNAIRTFKAHKSNIGAFDYDKTGRKVASFGDDRCVKLFDLSTDNGQPIWECTDAHSDFIRTGQCSQNQQNLIASGSYDHSVRLWDTRQTENIKPSHYFDHGSPVEKILFLPNENLLASAGGTFVNIWDIRMGKTIHILNNHRKTVTSLCLSKNGNYLLTGGIDRRINAIRIGNEAEIEPVYSFKVESTVLSLALDNEDKCMAFGMGNNKFSIYRRKEEEKSEKMEKKRKKSKLDRNRILADVLPKNVATKMENREENELRGLVAVEKEKDGKIKRIPLEITERQLEQLRLVKYDYFLRERRFNELVAKIMRSQNSLAPEYVVAVFQQIRIRQELTGGLSNQKMDVLRDLFAFFGRQLFHFPFFDILFDASMKTLDIYSRKPLTGFARKSLELFEKNVTKEIALQRELSRTIGMMELIMATTEEDEEEENRKNKQNGH